MKRFLLLAILLAACSGDKTAEPPTTTALATTSTTVTTTTTTATTTTLAGTPRNYSLIVAEHETKVRSAMNSAQACTFLRDRCDAVADINLVTLDFTLQAFIIAIEGAGTPTARTYQGYLNDSTARTLWSETLTHARTTAGLVQALHGCPLRDPCTSAAARYTIASAELTGDLTAWRRYR